MPLKWKNGLRFLDLSVWLGYIAALCIGVLHHEPWADEAQSWVIARDLPLRKMLFGEMHYEVSPGLWQTILWIAQHIFHAPYAAMNWIGAAFAIAGAGLLIFCAPFPRLVRYLMCSSFFVAYQYAVVARPYVLLLVCGAAAAIFYRRGKMIPLAVCLGLLCGTSVHGAIIAAAIAAGAFWQSITDWRSLEANERAKRFAALGVVVAAFAMTLVIARPAKDVVAINPLKGGDVAKLGDTLAHVTVGAWLPGAVILLAMAAFAVWRRQAWIFLLGVGGLLIFQSFFYGGPHHEGAIVIAIILALWIAYPGANDEMPRWFHPVALALLSGIFAIQTAWAVRAWQFDYIAPYSGGADMARFLRDLGAERDQTSAFAFASVAIQPYFERNIFANWPQAYVHHSQDSEPALSKLRDANLTEYIIVPSHNGDVDPNRGNLFQHGYAQVHISPGRVLDSQGIWDTETFTLYKKVR